MGKLLRLALILTAALGGPGAYAEVRPKSGAGAPVFLDLCNAGSNAVSAQCAVMTGQGAGPTIIGAAAVKEWDTTKYHQFKFYVHMGGTGSTTMDIDLQCDTAITFPSATTMVQITQDDLTASLVGSSEWTNFTANECRGDGVYFRPVAVGGDGIASPVIRQIWMAVK